MSIKIIVAMEKEAQYINPCLPNVEIIKTGIGLCNVVNTLALKLATGQMQLTDRIINVGYAGSNKYEVGDIVGIVETQRLCPSATVPENKYQLKIKPHNLVRNYGCCLTADDFCNEIINEIPAVDMELYYIKAMGFENVTAFKIISDNLNYCGYEKFEAEESWKKLNNILWEITNG